MSGENSKISRSVRAAFLLVSVIAAFLSAWAVVGYLHIVYLQNYLTSFAASHFSVIRLAGVFLVTGLAGGIASFPILRSLETKRIDRVELRRDTIVPPSHADFERVHPLMMSPRIARDSSFVIRKTSKQGRLSRNRDGERLSAGDTDSE